MVVVFLVLLCTLISVEYAEAVNNGDVRLAGYEATRLAGRLELYWNNEWRTICNDYFTLASANVACRQMGLGYAVQVSLDNDAESKRLGRFQDPRNTRYGSGSRNTRILSSIPYCHGNETHLLNCRIADATRCVPWEAVSIQCSDWTPQPYSGQVQLVGGAYASEGKLEVFFNGKWGNVCSTQFNQTAAETVCRQLGYTFATRLSSTFVRPSTTTETAAGETFIWLPSGAVSCDGIQSCLTSCITTVPVGLATRSCDQMNSSIVTISCGHGPAPLSTPVGSKDLCEVDSLPANLSVRLATARVATPTKGVVEVSVGQVWLPVCGDQGNFPPESAHVACRQLGFVAYTNLSTVDAGPSQRVVSSIVCNGGESGLSECKIKYSRECRSSQHVWLQCVTWMASRMFTGIPFGAATLMFGDGGSGLLRVWDGSSYNPVCDHTFHNPDADVVCRQMGYKRAKAVRGNAYYGGLRSPSAVLSHVHCNGSESTLYGCNHTVDPRDACDAYEHVGIQCLVDNDKKRGELRIYTRNNNYVYKTNGSSPTVVKGILEILLSGRWHPICSDEFPATAAHVACRQLGFSTYNGIYTDARFGRVGDGVFKIFSCNGHEESLYDCWHFPYHWSSCANNIAISCIHTYNTPVEGTLRLSPYRGLRFSQLEIFQFGRWGTVCRHGFDTTAGHIACRELGFEAVQAINTVKGANPRRTSALPVNVFSVSCNGSERTLYECEREIYFESRCTEADNILLRCGGVLPTTALNSLSTKTTNFLGTSKSAHSIDVISQDPFSRISVPNSSSQTLDLLVTGSPNAPLSTYSSMPPQTLLASTQAEPLPTSTEMVSMVTRTVSMVTQRASMVTPTASIIPQSISMVSQSVSMVSQSVSMVSQSTSMVTASTVVETVDPVPTSSPALYCPTSVDRVWNITWKRTIAGTISSQPCPSNGHQVTGIAERMCLPNGEWSASSVSECSTTFYRITHEQLSSFLLSDKPSVDDAKRAVETAKKLSEFVENVTKECSVCLFPKDLVRIVFIISMIARASHNFTEADSAEVVRILGRVSSFVLSEPNQPSWTTVHESTAVLLQSSMEQLTNGLGTSGNRSISILESGFALQRVTVSLRQGEEEIKLLASTQLDASKQTSEFLPVVTVPKQFIKETFNEKSDLISQNVSLVTFVLQNIEKYLPITTVEEGRIRNTSLAVGSMVASVQIAGVDSVSMPMTNNPVSIIFPLKEVANTSADLRYRCAFWDHKAESSKGAWSFVGVTTDVINASHIQCYSNHMTSFAVLVDISGITIDLPEVEYMALSMATYIGCGISFLCLILCIVFFACQKSELWTKISNYVHMNLCIALACGLLVFVAGVEHAKYHEVACTLVTALLHYFFLATFSWMLCEGILLYNLLVVVFGASRRRWIAAYALIGWGLPVPIVAITLGVKHDDYFITQSTNASSPGYDVIRACWLPSKDGVVLSFVAPMLATIAVNVILLVLSLVSLYKARKRVLKHARMNSHAHAQNYQTGKQLMKATVILLPLLGLTWGLGVLVVHPDMRVVAYLFLICNVFQGVLIFALHVLRHDKVWGKFKESIDHFKQSRKSSSSRTGSFKLNSNHVTSTNYSEGKANTSTSSEEDESTFISGHRRAVNSGRVQVLPMETDPDKERRPSTGNDEVAIVQSEY